MNIEALYQIYSSNYLVTTDTRAIKKDAVFFSLQGEHFNGNKFAAIAIEKGAKYAVIDDVNYQIQGKTILVNVF